MPSIFICHRSRFKLNRLTNCFALLLVYVYLIGLCILYGLRRSGGRSKRRLRLTGFSEGLGGSPWENTQASDNFYLLEDKYLYAALIYIRKFRGIGCKVIYDKPYMVKIFVHFLIY
jgi:hypothetical protein